MRVQSIRNYIRHNRRFLLASFFIPALIMAAIYLSIGIYPGSDRSVLASDAFSQFSNFHASFRNVLLGKQSIFYTWNASLGLNYLSLISYYLGGLFTPLVILFPNHMMPDALYALTLLKIGCAGLSFWIFANHSFKIPRWGQTALAVSYALMSFITAHSELIMWLDTFVYLPLIILGIHRLMDKRKPTLLFVSYLLMFLSSFYMGFMVGLFSFLYFFARLFTNWKRYKQSIIPYGITSLLAGGASMIIILPAILDLRTNGESLTAITQLKTEATSFWDIIMKNMVGVYDTTKYGSIPFIYVGLFPLILCVLYFVSNKTPRKNKILFGSLFAILIASFYFVPMNLFWHGMHAPNMFLFRYAFLFSFLVVLLAGYGWERLQQEDLGLYVGIVLILIAIVCLAWGTIPKGSYEYITDTNIFLTFAFLILYLLAVGFYQLKKIPPKRLTILLLLLMSVEAVANTHGTVNGILNDWNYASRSLYEKPYDAIDQLVAQTKERNDTFYRLENLDPVSSNDSINYGYSGVSLFSSIRNRNSSSYLDSLGFRSRGTNLNIRYPNNTLLMDSFVGIKYNIQKDTMEKFGFQQVGSADGYNLYENSYALPLAFTAPNTIYDVEQPSNDNLGSQTNLFNALSESEETYFQFYEPSLIEQRNVIIQENGSSVTYTEEQGNISKDLTWEVTIPAKTQAYLSLFPTDFGQLESSTVTIKVNGQARKTQININGQYYDLGYYPEETTIQFTASFYGTSRVSFMEPKVLALDTQAFQTSVEKIQANGAEIQTSGRKATGTVTADEDKVLLTTIPYDKGWKAYVDGNEVEITAFKDSFISISIPAGTHDISFSYLPQGFIIGLCLFIGCIILFIVWLRFFNKRTAATGKRRSMKLNHTTHPNQKKYSK